jgi:hypothetical protein
MQIENNGSANKRLDGRPGLTLVWSWLRLLPRRVSRIVRARE